MYFFNFVTEMKQNGPQYCKQLKTKTCYIFSLKTIISFYSSFYALLFLALIFPFFNHISLFFPLSFLLFVKRVFCKIKYVIFKSKLPLPPPPSFSDCFPKPSLILIPLWQFLNSPFPFPPNPSDH